MPEDVMKRRVLLGVMGCHAVLGPAQLLPPPTQHSVLSPPCQEMSGRATTIFSLTEHSGFLPRMGVRGRLFAGMTVALWRPYKEMKMAVGAIRESPLREVGYGLFSEE